MKKLKALVRHGGGWDVGFLQVKSGLSLDLPIRFLRPGFLIE